MTDLAGTWLHIYEARWHGYARWEVVAFIPTQGHPNIFERRVLNSGWVRNRMGFRQYRLVAE